MRAEPGVSVVLPNYNGRALLLANLPRVLEAGARYAGPFQCIVVDDGSTDGSAEMLRERFPGVEMVAHGANKGFAEAATSGVEHARFEIIILLNTDVRPEPDFIRPLVKWFERDDTFAVSPLIVDDAGRAGKVSWNRSYFRRGRLETRRWDVDEAMVEVRRRERGLESLFASGGSAALRKSVFLRLGGFLPCYKPFYFEDKDLGTRAWRCGWRTLFEPRSKVVHPHSGTIGRVFSREYRGMIGKRNGLLYLWIHASGTRLGVWIVPRTLRLLLLAMLRGEGSYGRALLAALRLLPAVLESRRALRNRAGTRTFEEILARFQSGEPHAGDEPPPCGPHGASRGSRRSENEARRGRPRGRPGYVRLR